MEMVSRKSIGFVALLSVIVMFACGKATDDASKTFGPAGPTTSGYLFELTASPAVLQNGGTTYLSVHVTNSAGTAVAGVVVTFSGSVTTIGTATTSATGYAGVSYTIDATVGDIVYLTATVENKSITAPIQIN